MVRPAELKAATTNISGQVYSFAQMWTTCSAFKQEVAELGLFQLVITGPLALQIKWTRFEKSIVRWVWSCRIISPHHRNTTSFICDMVFGSVVYYEQMTSRTDITMSRDDLRSTTRRCNQGIYFRFLTLQHLTCINSCPHFVEKRKYTWVGSSASSSWISAWSTSIHLHFLSLHRLRLGYETPSYFHQILHAATKMGLSSKERDTSAI